MPAPGTSRWGPVLVGAALPWTWFLLRDLGGPVEGVAVVLPVLVLAVLVVILGVAVGRRRATLLPVAASLLAFGLVGVVGPLLPHRGPAPETPLTLVSANLFWDNPTAGAGVSALLAVGADVEVAVETTTQDRAAMERLDTAHPYTATDDQLVVRSRYPVTAMLDPKRVPARRILRVTIEAPQGPFVLYAVHALNPLSESTFASQLSWVERLLAGASAESLPVVMAGDFNMSDRQLGYRMLAGALRDAITAGGWGHPTYADGIWAPLVLRIDHVFVSRDWCGQGGRTVDISGSDHDGVTVAIGPCP
ncbi:MAG: endonuclease/exonuclease/phosphatase family protein [Actinomycetota bacterium]